MLIKLRQSMKKAPLFQLFKHKYLPHSKDGSKSHLPLITFFGLKKFLKDNLFADFQPDFINNLDPDSNQIEEFMVRFPALKMYFFRILFRLKNYFY